MQGPFPPLAQVSPLAILVSVWFQFYVLFELRCKSICGGWFTIKSLWLHDRFLVLGNRTNKQNLAEGAPALGPPSILALVSKVAPWGERAD